MARSWCSASENRERQIWCFDLCDPGCSGEERKGFKPEGTEDRRGTRDS
jgi:hypothetical protein